MGLKLRITAGEGYDLKSQSLVAVNSPDRPVHISTDSFEGYLTVRIRDFKGIHPEDGDYTNDTEYFSETKDTSSIQVQTTLCY